MSTNAVLPTDQMLRDVHVVLVEDDPATLRVYRKWLEAAGANVLTFPSNVAFREALEGPNGWSTKNAPLPDLLVSDLILPDGNGIDVISLWRRYFPQRPALMITAFATVENAVEAMKTGAFDFLRKPLKEQELVIALKRAYDHGSLIRENYTLSSAVRVFGMAQTLASITDKLNLLKTVGRLLHREMLSDECFVFLYHAEKRTTECLFECRRPGLARTTPELVLQNVLTSSLKDRRPGVTDPEKLDLRLAPTFESLPVPEGNGFMIELKSQTGNSAFIVLFSRAIEEAQLLTYPDELQPILLQAAKAFQSADVTERMASFSYIDDLTGLYNQRYLQIALDREVTRSKKFGTSFSMIFFDLDGFKQVNDTHGHLVGSAILKEAARVLRENTRDSDVLLRYGGDEFVVILPNTKMTGAQMMGERIRHAFSSTSFDVRLQTGQSSASHVTVTVSLGISSFPECATNTRELISLADNAMYEAKRAGKNQMAVSETLKAS